MSPRQPNEAERRCRTLTCRKCGAAPGGRCMSGTGKPQAYCHGERYRDAVVANLLPLERT